MAHHFVLPRLEALLIDYGVFTRNTGPRINQTSRRRFRRNVMPVTSRRLETLAIACYKIRTLAFIQPGVMTMRQIFNPLGALCVLLVVGLAPPLAALAAKGAAKQAAKQEGPCGDVTAACERAGFARGAGGGAGLRVDCVNPIMQGTSQPKKASKPLPQIDPQVVAACKSSNPAFGQGKAPPVQPVAQPAPQPVPPSPPPPRPRRTRPRKGPRPAASGPTSSSSSPTICRSIWFNTCRTSSRCRRTA